MKKVFFLLFAFVLGIVRLFAQSFDFSDKAIEQRIRKDIYLLASDSLEGREAGSNGEYKARMYIASQFSQIGLKPLFAGNSYFQKFEIYTYATYGEKNLLLINNKNCRPYFDYYVLSLSGNDSVNGQAVFVGYGITAPERNYDDYKGLTDLKGKIFIIKTSLPDEYKNDDYFVNLSGKADKVALAIKKGASAVIFIRPDEKELEPSYWLSSADAVTTIPVIFLRNVSLLNQTGNNHVELKVNIVRQMTPAYNVAGYIDNGANSWVVIGAHYDHMGWNFAKSGKREIHNGADDNASGTAAVIEMARYFMNSAAKNNNYIFIAFSAEEKGLLGSDYFVRSDDFLYKNINYMINLDMVGRLNYKNKLIVFGTGTSPEWKGTLSYSNMDKLHIARVRSGVGGSDHMSFYRAGIPCLFLHTGLHRDYHTPADDADKIDYNGEVRIIKFGERLIEYLNDKGKIRFRRTSAFAALIGFLRFL